MTFSVSSGWMKVSVPLTVNRTGHNGLRIEVVMSRATSGSTPPRSCGPATPRRRSAPAPAPTRADAHPDTDTALPTAADCWAACSARSRHPGPAASATGPRVAPPAPATRTRTGTRTGTRAGSRTGTRSGTGAGPAPSPSSGGGLLGGLLGL